MCWPQIAQMSLTIINYKDCILLRHPHEFRWCWNFQSHGIVCIGHHFGSNINIHDYQGTIWNSETVLHLTPNIHDQSLIKTCDSFDQHWFGKTQCGFVFSCISTCASPQIARSQYLVMLVKLICLRNSWLWITINTCSSKNIPKCAIFK